MERDNDSFGEEWNVDRRSVLRGAVAVGAIGSIGLPAMSGSAVARATEETLYLTDSGGDNAGDFLGKLYSVDLDDSFSPPRANLSRSHRQPYNLVQ